MSNLATILLITLILFLVYLLYRRMLTMMGRDEAVLPFVHFLETSLELTRAHGLEVGLRVPEAMDVELNALSEDGTVLSVLHKGELDKGEHQFSANVQEWSTGNVLIVLQTDHQRAERYLKLD